MTTSTLIFNNRPHASMLDPEALNGYTFEKRTAKSYVHVVLVDRYGSRSARWAKHLQTGVWYVAGGWARVDRKAPGLDEEQVRVAEAILASAPEGKR